MRNFAGRITENDQDSNDRPQAHAYFSQELLKRIKSKQHTPSLKLRPASQAQASLNEASRAKNTQAPTSALTKYRTSRLSVDDVNTLSNALTVYLEQQKPYLDLRLTLTDLALALNVANHHLSQVINIGLNSNFNQLINRYRIQESLRLIAQDTSPRSNITRIQFDSGFGSKSVFHRVFKQYIGMTPKSYWEQCRAGKSTSIPQPLPHRNTVITSNVL